VKVTSPSDGPFEGGAAAVHLVDAPLVRVLCQVQWPEQTLLTTSFAQIADEIGIALAKEYPTRLAPQSMGFEFDPTSGQFRPQPLPPSRQWLSLDESWAIYLTPTFVTLENRGRYTSRSDMTQRFRGILAEIARSAQIPTTQRVGWRYVNRISDESDFADIAALVNESVLGARAIPVPGEVQLLHSFSDSLFIASNASLSAKWGFLPPNAAYDQNIQPVGAPSWFLDLDAFRESRAPFELGTLTAAVDDLASFAYDFFRWAVTDKFIDRFGG
jgi:uncharacterized protein (TIGR04255 family)